MILNGNNSLHLFLGRIYNLNINNRYSDGLTALLFCLCTEREAIDEKSGRKKQVDSEHKTGSI